MKILIVIAHPNKGSFNHAIAETVAEIINRNGYELLYHDLYGERFDPILPYRELSKDAKVESNVEQHCYDISDADGIIVIHPNWWGQPPAILKGWIDRVFRTGVAYEFLEGDSGEGVPRGLLKARAAIVFNTSNTPEEREVGVFGDPLETIWKNCIFDLCGVKHFYRKVFGVIVISTVEQREKWLNEVRIIVDRVFPKVSE